MTGTEIAIASMAIAAAGTAASMAAAQNAAKFQKAAADREAMAAEEAARQVRLEAAQQEALRLQDLAAIKATQKAQAAALGFDPTQSRSFLGIVGDTERKGQKDIANIRLAGLFAERRYLLKASAADIEGQAATSAGKFNTASAFLSGAGKITKIRKNAGWFSSTPSGSAFEPYGE
jgi:hypothetical protein